MKQRAVITLLIVSLSCIKVTFAQDWSAADRRSYAVRSSDPAMLSRQLSETLRSDGEKARAFFRWIADNISYYRLPARPQRFKDKLHGYQMPEDTGALPSLTERVARKVLADKRTHCEGFARLFQSLCEHASIPSVIITGFAPAGRGDRYTSNHAWNAVYFDSAWHLLDVTWAAGYFQMGRPDATNYANSLFMAAPSEFFQHHVPDDLRWTLLANPQAVIGRQSAAYRSRSYGKYAFAGYWPSKSELEASLGDTLEFSIKLGPQTRNHNIAPDSLWDQEFRWQSEQVLYLEPVSISGQAAHYRLAVQHPAPVWIQLMYNNDVVLRYRLRLLPGPASLTTTR
jgi:hypothetical protein